MGYTHYWEQHKNLDEKTWNKFVTAVNEMYKLLPKFSTSSGSYYSEVPLKLVGGDEEINTLPLFDNSNIIFNGYLENGHEGFYLTNEVQEYSFCKTNRKPYDLMVQVTLLLYKHYFKKDVSISSDGIQKEWVQAFELVKQNYKSITKKNVFVGIRKKF